MRAAILLAMTAIFLAGIARVMEAMHDRQEEIQGVCFEDPARGIGRGEAWDDRGAWGVPVERAVRGVLRGGGNRQGEIQDGMPDVAVGGTGRDEGAGQRCGEKTYTTWQ